MSKAIVPVTLSFAASALLALPAHAATLEVSIEVPKLKGAEYHRPYVAVWIEDGEQKAVANLSVWYQQTANAEGHGTKWLPDLRQWWRKSGRSLQVPVDGVTGPTRPAGTHKLVFGARQLAGLKPGQHTLVVEAVREVGGRELLKLPLQWPARAPQSGKAQGNAELGAVSFNLKP